MVKKIFSYSKYVTFALLVGYLGCEGWLRLYKGESMALAHYPLIYISDSVVGYRGLPNAKGYIRRPSIEKSFVLNNHGFFGPDFQPQHPDSIYRIMVFGSSYVEGIWGNNKESFPAIANRMFREKGYRVEVINCGLSGASRDLLNMYLAKDMAATYHPDLILLESPLPISNVYCFRDFYKGYSITYTGDNSEERAHSRWAARTKVDLLYEHRLATDMYDLSYCLRLWARRSADTPGNIAHTCLIHAKNCCDNWMYFSSVSTLSYEESIGRIEELQASVAPAKLALFEYGDTWLGQKFKEHPDLITFPFISLDVPLDKKEYSLQYDCHPNNLGYTTIARNLYDQLVAHFIPDRFRPKSELLSSVTAVKTTTK